MKTKRSLKIIALIVFLSSVILEIWLINRLSSMGGKFNQIKEAQASIEFENQIIENEISSKSSLATTQNLSSRLGFAPTLKNIEYFKPDVVASLP